MEHLTSNMVCNQESQQSFTCIFEKKKRDMTTFIVDTKEFGYSDIRVGRGKLKKEL